MAKLLKIVNIKTDMPLVDDARRRLLDEIKRAKAEGCSAIKLIHGYGSTGVGGALRTALRESLARRRKEGKIRGYIYGEKWDVFEPAARDLLEACPELRRDQDISRSNEGVTFILL
jgi:Arc/MetJ family transcription regulator